MTAAGPQVLAYVDMRSDSGYQGITRFIVGEPRPEMKSDDPRRPDALGRRVIAITVNEAG